MICPYKYQPQISPKVEHGCTQHVLQDVPEKQDLEGAENILFFVRSSDPTAAIRIAQTMETNSQYANATFTVIFTPRISLSTKDVLKNFGQDIHFYRELALGLVAVDDDMISMGAATVFRDFHVHSDCGSSYDAALALREFESIYGKFPSVHAMGPAAKYVAQILREETEPNALAQQHAHPRSQPS